MKVFLDCGAWNGASVNFFKTNHPEGEEFKVFCFEPLPENIEKLKAVDDIGLIPKAVWVKDTTLRFYKGMTESGTLYKEKTTGNVSPYDWIDVKTVDLARFIKENLRKEYYIVCKLNIEGAEYNVLPHLKREGVLDWVDKWYIQWHWNKIKMSKEEHDKVVNLVKWDSWGAMTNKVEDFKKSL